MKVPASQPIRLGGSSAAAHLPAATALGWECPRCGATYAPWMASCTTCSSGGPAKVEIVCETRHAGA